MNRDSKNMLSWAFAGVGFLFLSVVFNTIGLILGLQVKEEGGSSAPAIVNGVSLLFWAIINVYAGLSGSV